MSDEYKVPHVHKALIEIRKALNIDKDGVLPGNMGGKSYVSAGNLAAHLKSAFDEHDLLFYAEKEYVYNHEITQDKTQRTLVGIAIEGQYKIVSAVDGSSITISGAGDGLATGTSVANNIASTNAAKNAMLRLVMATEGGVEDSAKNGIGRQDDEAPKASGLDAVRARLVEKSKNVPGDVTGSAYLQVLLDSASGDLAGRKLAQVWSDESALNALEALLEAAK